MFVLAMLEGKRAGTYLEIGAFDPVYISNTYLLESEFGWSGVSVDIDSSAANKFNSRRSNPCICADALTLDYENLLKKIAIDSCVDYLQVDIEPKSQSLECLKRLPMNQFRFSVITFETDFYDDSEGRQIAVSVREESRRFLSSLGYLLVGPNIANTGPGDVFEDWWVDPEVVSPSTIRMAARDSDFNDSGERLLLNGPHVICTELYEGQGLGNQLWAYAAIRSIADSRQCSFGFEHFDRFKGVDIFDLDPGFQLSGGSSPEGGPPHNLPEGIRHYRKEAKQVISGTSVDISRMDASLLQVPIDTKIDGTLQSTGYLPKDRGVTRSWFPLKRSVNPEFIRNDVCLIHVRGGDFSTLSEVSLTEDYFSRAIDFVRSRQPNVKFECVTDDPTVAVSVLPNDVEIVGSALEGTEDSRKAPHHKGGPVGRDFLRLLHARFLIIPNSSFSWWAAYLNVNAELIIAPKYWARHNVNDGFWSTTDIITDGFTYLDSEGRFADAADCRAQQEVFMQENAALIEDVRPTPFTEWKESLSMKVHRWFRHARLGLTRPLR